MILQVKNRILNGRSLIKNMAIRKIKTGANNPVLRQKAEEIREITPEIKEVVLDMLDTVRDKNDLTAGLAAPQIGKSVRIIAVRSDTSDKPVILISTQPELLMTNMIKIICRFTRQSWSH